MSYSFNHRVVAFAFRATELFIILGCAVVCDSQVGAIARSREQTVVHNLADESICWRAEGKGPLGGTTHTGQYWSDVIAIGEDEYTVHTVGGEPDRDIPHYYDMDVRFQNGDTYRLYPVKCPPPDVVNHHVGADHEPQGINPVLPTTNVGDARERERVQIEGSGYAAISSRARLLLDRMKRRACATPAEIAALEKRIDAEVMKPSYQLTSDIEAHAFANPQGGQDVNAQMFVDKIESMRADVLTELDRLKQKKCPPPVVTEFDRKLWHRLKTGARPGSEPVEKRFDPDNMPVEQRVEIGCVDRPSSEQLCSFAGFYVGGSIGVRGNKDSVTNENQVTFFGPDLRPDPAASSSNTGVYGNIALGYNSLVPLGSTMSGLVGGEIFIGAGSNSSTISGIPGTGGIAGPAVMANDSTNVRETWDAGIVGKVGPVVQIGNIPVYFAFDAGVGFLGSKLTANCTAAGACGVNGIPAQTLSVSKTLTGSLIGFEVGLPLASALGSSAPADNVIARVLRTANIRVQYLHGDYGHATGTAGNPAQIQLTLDQKITTNAVTFGINFPLSLGH
jgi:hypothetical protein